MNNNAAVIEHSGKMTPMTKTMTLLYKKSIIDLTERRLGMPATKWPVEPPMNFAVLTAEGSRRSPWE